MYEEEETRTLKWLNDRRLHYSCRMVHGWLLSISSMVLIGWSIPAFLSTFSTPWKRLTPLSNLQVRMARFLIKILQILIFFGVLWWKMENIEMDEPERMEEWHTLHFDSSWVLFFLSMNWRLTSSLRVFGSELITIGICSNGDPAPRGHPHGKPKLRGPPTLVCVFHWSRKPDCPLSLSSPSWKLFCLLCRLHLFSGARLYLPKAWYYRLSLSLSLFLPLCLCVSLSLSLYLAVFLCLHSWIYLSINKYVSISNLSASSSIYLSIYLSILTRIYISIASESLAVKSVAPQPCSLRENASRHPPQ